MSEKTMAEQINDVIRSSPMLIDDHLNILRDAAKELATQDKVIEYLYEALGPAADDIINMAYEAAEKY